MKEELIFKPIMRERQALALVSDYFNHDVNKVKWFHHMETLREERKL